MISDVSFMPSLPCQLIFMQEALTMKAGTDNQCYHSYGYEGESHMGK